MATATVLNTTINTTTYIARWGVVEMCENTDVDQHGNIISDGPDYAVPVFVCNSRREAEIRLCWLQRANPAKWYQLDSEIWLRGSSILHDPPEGVENTKFKII
jgi:hypothetical protein